MITNEVIQQTLLANPEVVEAIVSGDGYHYNVTIVSDAFINKSKVARQQWVYAQLKDYITAGSLHALSMKTWTITEWESQRG